jgi:hypothetical protein
MTVASRNPYRLAVAYAILLAACFTFVGCGSPRTSHGNLQVSKIRELSDNGLVSGSTVSFRGVATYADSANHLLFVQDATGAIEIDTSELLELPEVNRLVEVHGHILRTSRGPMVADPSVVSLAPASPPHALVACR